MNRKTQTWNLLVGVLALGVLLALVWILQFVKHSHFPHPRQLTERALAEAVEAYYSDNNRLPELPRKMVTDHGGGVELLKLLTAEEMVGGGGSSGKVVYLFLQEAKGKKNGLYYGVDGASVEALYDAYGRPFRVVLNSDYDDTLVFRWGSEQVRLRGRQVAVWSLGKDGREGTEDDVTSWRRERYERPR